MAWSKDKGTIAKVNADYAKVQGDYAKTEANKVERMVEDNKTKWLPAVATVALRNSTYPNPQHGDTVRVTSEAKTYRYVSPTGWVVTDIYDATAIDQVATQLAQTEADSVQVDFVNLLQQHNASVDEMLYKIKGDRRLLALVKLPNGEYASYELNKDGLDDFIKFEGGSIYYYGNETTENPTQLSPESYSGVFSTTEPNLYTREIGATFTRKFTGSGFDFRHYANNQGGVWKFVIDGDENKAVLYSTFSATVVNVKRSPIIRDLPQGEHTVVATFMGDDPNNPPSGGAGTSRGWVRVVTATPSTFVTYDSVHALTEKNAILAGASNREFALRVRPYDSTFTYQWIPEHNSIPTAFAVSQAVYVDGVEITDWTVTDFLTGKSIQCVQKLQAIHPDAPTTPLANIFTVHTINKNGMTYNTKFDWLVKTSIANGYNCMFPVFSSFGNELITSRKNRYDTTLQDGSNSNLTDNDLTNSFIFVNNTANDKINYAVAMTVNDVKNTFRHGKTDKRSPLFWVEHRTPAISSMQKLYPQSYLSTVAEVGDRFVSSATFTIGILPMAADVI